MRHTALALLCAAPLAACISSPTITFDTPVTGSTTIPGSSLPFNLSGTLPGFDHLQISQQGTLANQNTDKDHLRHVHVKSLSLTASAPQGSDLSFLSSLSFTLAAPGLADQRIAHQTVFPKGQATVLLLLDDADLVAFAKADSISIKTTAQGQSPAKDTTIDIAMVLTIEAAIL